MRGEYPTAFVTSLGSGTAEKSRATSMSGMPGRYFEDYAVGQKFGSGR